MAALLAVAAAPAQAKKETAGSGTVTATFSYTKQTDRNAPLGGRYRDLRLRVSRAGTIAYDKRVGIPDCEAPYCVPGGYKKSSVQVVDLDANGEPEITLDVYTGGAHCCLWTLVLAWSGSAYTARTHDWRDPGYALKDANGDGKQEFVSTDARFAYEFASFAGSGFPVQIWDFDGAAGFVDVTGQYPDAIAADRDRWWRSFQRQRRRKSFAEPLGPLAAWAADEYRLGNGSAAMEKIRTLQRQHKLKAGISGLGAHAKRFPAALSNFLAKLGYA